MKASHFLRIAIFLIALTLYPAISFGSGNELLRQCNGLIQLQETKETIASLIDVGKCMGLVQGVRDTVAIYQEIFKESKITCIPKSVENGQIARIIVKYLNDNPEQLHEGDAMVAIFALQKAFPCK